MRAPFRPVSRGDLLLFPCAFKRLFGALRRRLLLSRRADDCRLLPLRFECLAKFIWLRIWSRTFGLPMRQLKTSMRLLRRRAEEIRGAVPAGQEFVFVNLGRRRRLTQEL
jgi:hypothetical protein